MKTIGSTFVILFLVIAICILSSAFIVSETKQVVITRLGEPMGDPIKEPGLYFKMPFLETANYFEDRVLEWDGDANQIPTKDKKYIWIDTTARWRIINPLAFMQTVQSFSGAQQRLDAVLDGTTRNVVADKNLSDVVRSSNRIIEVIKNREYDVTSSAKDVELIADDSGRNAIRLEILEKAIPEVREFGIELIDLRIKRINYGSDVRQDVFNRMRSERQQAADKYRSEGEAERARIKGLQEKEANRISSEAYRKAELVRGNADAEAIKIYADAYSKDEEFYAFLRTLETYKTTLGKGTTLVLSTDNDYLNFLKDIEGGK